MVGRKGTAYEPNSLKTKCFILCKFPLCEELLERKVQMREIIRNIYYYHPNFVENFLMIKKAVESRHKCAFNILLEDSERFLYWKSTIFPTAKNAKAIGLLRIFTISSEYRNVTRLDAKDGIVKCDEHSRNIQITFKTQRRIAYNRRQCGAGMRHRDEPQLLSTTVATFSLHH
uniref:Uncharacterized protein n=1 Tax=Wuchereria bancrofti TaxID=6293 RepID=A0A1I8EXU7_WUCBA